MSNETMRVQQRGMNKGQDQRSTYKSAAERFWLRVEVGEGCWLWKAGTQATGHGRFYADRKAVPAHRFSYELLIGPIPEGLVIDHLCRNPSCVNPDHLEPVTQGENIRRGDNQGPIGRRASKCPLGHPYDEINTYISPSGIRDCRECRREAGRRHRAKRRIAMRGTSNV